MLRSYLILALRNLRRHRFYALINVFGLSVGVACLLVAVIYAHHAYSFNRNHEKLDRTFRVVRQIEDVEGTHYSIYTAAMARHLEEALPDVEHAVQIFNRMTWIHSAERGYNARMCVASPAFRDVFTYPLLTGDPDGLVNPGTAFLTQSFARKLFGEADPIGQIATIDHKWVKGDFEIVGILADIPANSDPKLQFDLLTASYPQGSSRTVVWDDWNWTHLSTHLLVRPGTDIQSLTDKVREVAKRHEMQAAQKGHYGYSGHEEFSYDLQPGSRMHLFTTHDYGQQRDGPTGSISRVYSVLGIGFLVLALACLNYINLVTAQSDLRGREVGLRKVSGALKHHLVVQFLGESVLLSSLAFVIAIAISTAALPYVSTILGVQLVLSHIDPVLLLVLPVTIVLIVGVLSGFYPALVISRYKPIVALTGRDSTKGSGFSLRRVLVVLQFTASTALVISTFILSEQIAYVQNKDLGFERDSIVALPMFSSELWPKQAAIRQEAEKIGNVESASVAGTFNGGDFRTVSLDGAANESHKFLWTSADDYALATFNVPLLHGRNLTVKESLSPDPYEWDVLINETGAKLIGWTPGSTATLKHERPGRFHVVGVFADFHNQSLRSEIMPMVITPPYTAVQARYLYARLGPGDVLRTLDSLKQVWRTFIPDRPFSFTFMNDQLDAKYRAEIAQRRILTLFSGLAIAISCLGVLGLVTYSARRRRREIGIRKTLGADGRSIIALLSREFLALVLTAFIVATPIAYTFSREWLNAFVYRIEMPIGAFLAGGVLTLALVSVSIGVQTIRAARENPVDSLRQEQ